MNAENNDSDMCLNKEIFLYSPSGCSWVVLWICFLNYLGVKNTSLFNFNKKKTDTRFIGDARLF